MTIQPQVLVMMFGQRLNKLLERLGGGGFGPVLIFALDQCDALAMHTAHAKLGLPCQSASLANSYSCHGGAGELRVIPIQIGAGFALCDDDG